MHKSNEFQRNYSVSCNKSHSTYFIYTYWLNMIEKHSIKCNTLHWPYVLNFMEIYIFNLNTLIQFFRHHLFLSVGYMFTFCEYFSKTFMHLTFLFVTVRQRLSTTSTMSASPLLSLSLLAESQLKSSTSHQFWPHLTCLYPSLDWKLSPWRFLSQSSLYLRASLCLFLFSAKLNFQLWWGVTYTTWRPQWLPAKMLWRHQATQLSLMWKEPPHLTYSQ